MKYMNAFFSRFKFQSISLIGGIQCLRVVSALLVAYGYTDENMITFEHRVRGGDYE